MAILLSIGDELALGQTVDTNTAFMAAGLAERGVMTRMHLTVADEHAALAAAFRQAVRLEAASPDPAPGLVIASGGLGPTEDDLTREALAEAMGVGLGTDEEALAAVRSFFSGIGKAMPPRNEIQAQKPIGSRFLPNPHGTAPGIHAVIEGVNVFVTPGVPREMRAMFSDAILPLAVPDDDGGGVLVTSKVATFGMGESDVSQRLAAIMARGRNPTVGTTVAAGYCSVRLRAEAASGREARAMLEAVAGEVEAALGPVCFGRDEETLENATVTLLLEKGLTVTTAESCTGGLVSEMLTRVPGSSGCCRGGWVTYDNAMKSAELGVAAATLAQHGAVSAEVVKEMAEGAREHARCDFGIALSGVAGPGGGTQEKPVGTVWIALAGGAGVRAWRGRFRGDRATVRDRAAKCALQLLRLRVLGEDTRSIQWLQPEAP
ncbi:competence/damage-inducible protein A [Phycisphaera mikurensis]|uniref:CinA-like protein n=1 Tax=Phycisphaera mikurensis (strain NBRC 102666 / KCTC 22515 / FYK2301M01) TaxID=1142394 RepID=I0IFP7_PHYMF|nr:competence/damage-inducible protein A [Phycisphaera mikurensis]MBB6440525.1 nicotinamide-nucleotide amidase [Phycisphaera mikurensis]BAM04085.1 CinA-like protein [Phycisphaera mikurensis NBRC 102666]